MPKSNAVSQEPTQWEPVPGQEDELQASDRPLTRAAWLGMGAGLFCLWSPVFLSLILSAFDDGTRLMMGIKPLAFAVDPILYLGAYWAAIHFLLSFPLTQFGYVQTKTFPNTHLRWMTLFALTSAPLCSYAYYRAGNLNSGQWVEILLAVLPASFAASLSYWRTEKRWLFSTLAAVGTYMPVFMVNDLMGPFSTYFAYASAHEAFYYFRYVGPAMGMGFCAWLFLFKRNLLGAADISE